MDADQERMLDWVRRVIQAALWGQAPPSPEGLPEVCRQSQGCFVTLSRHGQLRGCIGHIQPLAPLGEALATCARAAAFEDSRFLPLRPEEWSDLELEISLLTQPSPLEVKGPDEVLTQLRPHVDGVILEHGGRRATFLPQVWEQLPEPRTFLAHLSRKAGGTDQLWRHPGSRFLTYQVCHFQGPAQE